jgi:hypothetical protein
VKRNEAPDWLAKVQIGEEAGRVIIGEAIDGDKRTLAFYGLVPADRETDPGVGRLGLTQYNLGGPIAKALAPTGCELGSKPCHHLESVLRFLGDEKLQVLQAEDDPDGSMLIRHGDSGGDLLIWLSNSGVPRIVSLHDPDKLLLPEPQQRAGMSDAERIPFVRAVFDRIKKTDDLAEIHITPGPEGGKLAILVQDKAGFRGGSAGEWTITLYVVSPDKARFQVFQATRPDLQRSLSEEWAPISDWARQLAAQLGSPETEDRVSGRKKILEGLTKFGPAVQAANLPAPLTTLMRIVP